MVQLPEPAPLLPAPAGWEGILDPGETILWQGRPDGSLVIRPAHIATGVFGLFFAGFALFWMMMASMGGGYFWMFGLLHFGVGLGVMVGGPLYSLILRRRSWYTLTSRRAILASDLPVVGRRLESYPISRDTPITFEESDPFASIHFATRQTRGRNGVTTHPVGFERIAEGRRVLALMRQLQSELP